MKSNIPGRALPGTSTGRPIVFVLCLVGFLFSAVEHAVGAEEEKRVTSHISTADNGDVFVAQESVVDASAKKVWAALTTTESWQAWAAPVVSVDLKIGGVIKTNYKERGTVDDETANTLHIINYVPERVLTLQAEVSNNWPDVLKEREKQLFNVITLEPITGSRTKVVSHGIGYRDTPELQRLLKFFVPPNAMLYEKLIKYVEKK